MNFIESLQPQQSILTIEKNNPKANLQKNGRTYQLVTINQKKPRSLSKALLAIIGMIISLVKKDWKEWADAKWKEAWEQSIQFKAYLNSSCLPDQKTSEAALPFLSGKEIAELKPVSIGYGNGMSVKLHEIVFFKLNETYYCTTLPKIKEMGLLKIIAIDAAKIQPFQVLDFSQFPQLSKMPNQIFEKIFYSVGFEDVRSKNLEDLLYWSDYLGIEQLYLDLCKNIEKQLIDVEFLEKYESYGTALKKAIDRIMKNTMKWIENTEKSTKIIKDNIFRYSQVRFSQDIHKNVKVEGLVNPETGELVIEKPGEKLKAENYPGMIPCKIVEGYEARNDKRVNVLIYVDPSKKDSKDSSNEILFEGSVLAKHVIDTSEDLIWNSWDYLKNFGKQPDQMSAFIDNLKLVEVWQKKFVEAYKAVKPL